MERGAEAGVVFTDARAIRSARPQPAHVPATQTSAPVQPPVGVHSTHTPDASQNGVPPVQLVGVQVATQLPPLQAWLSGHCALPRHVTQTPPRTSQ